jgi:hypothetical protein
VAIGYVLFSAISFDEHGKTNHSNHAAMWMMISACFLPGGSTMKQNPRELLRSFFGMQLTIGMLYSCAGICKAIGFFCDLPSGITWFSPDALPLTISQNWTRSSETLLGGFFVLHPVLAMVGQTSAFALELFALPALLFRQLHRPWAVLLVGMHTMILASMRIHFHELCFVLLLFIGASPFATSLKATAEWLVHLRRRSLLPAPAASKPASFSIVWPPTLVAFYLVLAFSRFDSKAGEFKRELYPVSAMPMFFRIQSRHHARAGLPLSAHTNRRGSGRHRAAHRPTFGQAAARPRAQPVARRLHRPGASCPATRPSCIGCLLRRCQPRTYRQR